MKSPLTNCTQKREPNSSHQQELEKRRVFSGNGESGTEMEEKDEGGLVKGVVDEYWWWATASTAQLGWGITAFRKGYAGDSRLMPFKAFAVASLFVGAAACAAMTSLRASGISSVEDMKTSGANIRTGLGLHHRARDE